MNRTSLLRTLSAAALAAFAAPAMAAPVIIQGGGATSPQGDYAGPNNPNTGAPLSEFSLYNSAQTAVAFGTYWGSGSGTGQTAFLNDDLTCDINKVTGANGGKCSGTVGGANTVHYSTSDFVLNSTQTSQWSTSAVGQAAAGDLVQLPMLGTGTAIVVNDTNITANGQLVLSDSDLCGIFSGLITDFSQITDSTTQPASGAFKFVYRSDSAATTFIITTHLQGVCSAANTAPGVTFTATSTFSTLFPGGNVTAAIPNAIGQSGSAGVANYIAGLSSGPIPQALGYLSPDWTSIPPAPDSFLSNGQRSELLVAGLLNGGKSYLPTTINITSALAHVKSGINLTPPANATQAANPLAWVPYIQSVSQGYPLVGYGTIDLAQCYANAKISKGLIAYLKDHYGIASYKTIQANNGLVTIANSGASKFLAAVKKNILANANGWNTNIGDATACAGKAGR